MSSVLRTARVVYYSHPQKPRDGTFAPSWGTTPNRHDYQHKDLSQPCAHRHPCNTPIVPLGARSLDPTIVHHLIQTTPYAVQAGHVCPSGFLTTSQLDHPCTPWPTSICGFSRSSDGGQTLTLTLTLRCAVLRLQADNDAAMRQPTCQRANVPTYLPASSVVSLSRQLVDLFKPPEPSPYLPLAPRATIVSGKQTALEDRNKQQLVSPISTDATLIIGHFGKVRDVTEGTYSFAEP